MIRLMRLILLVYGQFGEEGQAQLLGDRGAAIQHMALLMILKTEV